MEKGDLPLLTAEGGRLSQRISGEPVAISEKAVWRDPLERGKFAGFSLILTRKISHFFQKYRGMTLSSRLTLVHPLSALFKRGVAALRSGFKLSKVAIVSFILPETVPS